MDLKATCDQAVTDLGVYTDAAAVVQADQARLNDDQSAAMVKAGAAQASAKAAISALTDALAAMPATSPG